MKGGGANKACAACKYQRRRCSKECPLAPFFPADRPKTFSNAHRLFGVANIMRILNQVEPDEQDETMKSIIFESDIRAKYPQHGCYGVIMQYQGMLYKEAEELQRVQTLLALYKESNYYHMQHHYHHLMSTDQTYLLPPITSKVEFPMYNNNGENVSSFDGNVIYDYSPYIERKDILMTTSPSSSGITDVNASVIDAKPNLTSMQRLSSGHGELNIPTTDARSVDIPIMDARSAELSEITSTINAKSNLMLMLPNHGLSCHEEEDIPSSTDAKSNLRLMSSNDYEEQNTSAICFTSYNTKPIDAKFDSMEMQGLSTYNELDIFQHDDDIAFNQFANGSKNACESSVESESSNQKHIQGLHNYEYLFVRSARA